MSQVGETAVKVFGWTITSVYHDPLSPLSSSSSSSSSLQSHMINNQSDTDQSEQDNTILKISSSDLNNESKETSENSDDQHSEITTSSQEKTTTLKKPDKILPCPRCKSSDTKFCYYNNYNVNQPRYFCRNCQRYWTSGGSMRTVPVGSGRRKNIGWVSSDPSNIDYTNNYISSSTKILSFESSDSLVTGKGSNHSYHAKITPDSISQDSNKFQGFLAPQVTSTVSPLWPYQYPPNPSFYHMPVSWVPVWCPQENSTTLGKRTRDEASNVTKDAFVRAILVSESPNEESLGTKNHLWYPTPTKREKTEKFSFFKKGSETNRFVPQTYLSLQANPAAMARSMSFRESV